MTPGSPLATHPLTERLRALEGTGLLDSAPEAAFDRLTDLVRRALGVPVALISLVAGDRQYFKSEQGLSEPWRSRRETPLSHSFCRHVVDGDHALVVDDARTHPLVCENPAIEEIGVVAYLGVPLRTPDGTPIGSLCAIDTSPRAWTDRDRTALEALAEAAMTEIAVREHLRERDRARAALARTVETLEARVDERTREARDQAARSRALSRALAQAEEGERQRVAHVLHDDLQQVLFGARVAARAGDEERVGALLDRAVRVVQSLSHELAPPVRRDGTVRDLLQWLAHQAGDLHRLDVEVDVPGPDLAPPEAERVLLYRAGRELLFNVAKHAGVERVRLTAEVVARGGTGSVVRLVVEDEGCGFDAAALEGKATERPPAGIGLSSLRDRVELAGGRLRIESAPGAGARVTVEVPAPAEP